MNYSLVGSMIAKIRTQKGMTKTELARLTGINIGHLTHIEKAERKPSSGTLRKICEALGYPYHSLKSMTDVAFNEDQASYELIERIAANKLLLIDSIGGFIDCPAEHPDASAAIKVTEASMEPTLKVGSHIFVQYNVPLDNNDIGLFNINDDVLIRKFSCKNGKIVLKADNKAYDNIKVSEKDTFYIIGKVLV